MPSRRSDDAASGDAGAERLKKMRIVIVENHDDTRFLLGLLLEQLGHTVTAAATMREGMGAARAGCDVLISDIGLPDGDGWQLMEHLGAERPRYAIAMSGFGMVSDRQKSLAAGYRHHLLKPVEPNQLESLLDEAARELVTEGARGGA
jgi:two-component system CheB/CheR fusion protein